MGDLPWSHKGLLTFPLAALRHHAVCLGASGSGKTETLYRCAYGARKVYGQQVIYLDAKGEAKRAEEKEGDNAARFVAVMRAAGARSIKVFPALHYDGWKGTPTELLNRLLSVIDFSESEYYGDVAANALALALYAPTTPRCSTHFLANLDVEQLKRLYKHDPEHYAQVLRLKKDLLAQVRMRYEVFFTAMRGQLDGTLSYEEADAVYLRVRGFTLRNEAPRLGRFLVTDFMHYIAERRKPGVSTLFIIDEFNALRMREETSILFEQVRSFGGNLIIAAQGYAGLGPREYADRILDATNTYIVHSCSDPFPVIRRAGKRFRLDHSWSEQGRGEGGVRRQVRSRWDWKVPENAVMQQVEGQAFWISRGRAQQAQTVRVSLMRKDVEDAWEEIRRQEESQYREWSPQSVHLPSPANQSLLASETVQLFSPSSSAPEPTLSNKTRMKARKNVRASQEQPGIQKSQENFIKGTSKTRMPSQGNDTILPACGLQSPQVKDDEPDYL